MVKSCSRSKGIEKQAVSKSLRANEKIKWLVGDMRTIALTINAKQAKRFPISAMIIMTTYADALVYFKPEPSNVISDVAETFDSEIFIADRRWSGNRRRLPKIPK